MELQEQIKDNFRNFLEQKGIKFDRVLQVWQTVWTDGTTDISGMYVGEDNKRYLISSKDK